MRHLFVGILFIFNCAACNFDHQPGPYLSKNISQSKKDHTFLCQYNIDSLKSFTSLSFGVIEVWLEMNCWQDADASGKVTLHINKEASPSLIIKMDSSLQLTEKNYLNEWIFLTDANNPTGLNQNLINIKGPKAPISGVIS